MVLVNHREKRLYPPGRQGWEGASMVVPVGADFSSGEIYHRYSTSKPLVQKVPPQWVELPAGLHASRTQQKYLRHGTGNASIKRKQHSVGGMSEVKMAKNVQRDWRELCVAVTNESDSTKLSSLVQELLEALDRGERGWRQPVLQRGARNSETA